MYRIFRQIVPLLLAPCTFSAAGLAQVVAPTPSAAALPVPATKTQTPLVPQHPVLEHPVLDRVRRRGTLNCGVAKEEEDYSRSEDHGNRAALDIDFCQAVAVAVLGPGTQLVIKSFPDEPAANAALQTGDIDLLASGSPTVANTARGFTYTPPILFDGQGFLLPKNPAVHTPLDLAGKKVCFLTASDAEAGLHSYAAKHGIGYIWYPFSEAGEMEAAFFTGNCDAVTGDVTSLANIRGIGGTRLADYTILPQLIRQDPLAAATFGDAPFAALVSWTLQALIAAEQLHVTQAGVHALLSSPTLSSQPELQQLLGQRYGIGSLLGLQPHWAADVVQAVGNYGEIFDRDLGDNSALHLDRGENQLWTAGGLQFALPLTDH